MVHENDSKDQEGGASGRSRSKASSRHLKLPLRGLGFRVLGSGLRLRLKGVTIARSMERAFCFASSSCFLCTFLLPPCTGTGAKAGTMIA